MEPMEDDISELDGFQIQMLVRSARKALKDGSYRKAELLCNKALALDAANTEVLLLKADAITHQTRPENNRTLEIIACCSSAIAAAEVENKEALKNVATQKVKLALMFYMGFVVKVFVAAGGEENGRAVRLLPRYMQDCAAEWKNACGVEILSNGIRNRVARAMTDAACETWGERTLAKYESDGARSKDELDAFVNAGDLCISIIESAAAFNPNDLSGNASRYRWLIEIMGKLVDAYSLREDQGQWVRDHSLAKADKKARRKRISTWRSYVKAFDAGHAPARLPESHDVLHAEGRAKKDSLAFLAVAFISLIANAMLLVSVFTQIARWVPAMTHGDLPCILFVVAAVAGGLSFASCLADVSGGRPSKRTGRYLAMCAIALLVLALMGWDNAGLGPLPGMVVVANGIASPYFLLCGTGVGRSG